MAENFEICAGSIEMLCFIIYLLWDKYMNGFSWRFDWIGQFFDWFSFGSYEFEIVIFEMTRNKGFSFERSKFVRL